MSAPMPMAEGSQASLRSPRGRWFLGMLVLIGAGAFLLGARSEQPVRAWQIYLVNYLFWSGLAVAGVVLVAMLRVCHSGWVDAIQGVAVATFGFVPVAILAFLPLVLGRAHIFPWWPHPAPNRTIWLDATFLFTRDFFGLLLLYTLCATYAYFLLRPAAGASSVGPQPAGGLRGWLVRGWRGAEVEQARAGRILSRLGPPLLILYAFVYSLVGFDLVMSLDQGFSSTLFGGYYFMTNLYMGLAFLVVLLGLWLKRDPELKRVVAPEELHPLGKLIFGFCMLYTLLFWSQYLVIWYGNLSHEIPYIYLRQHVQPWATLSYSEIFASLLIPFCILLSRPVKRNSRALAAVGLLILVGMWLERYVLVVPALWHSGESTTLAANGPAATSSAVSLPLGWLELGVTAGFAAAFLLCYDAFARVFPIALGAPTGERRAPPEL